MTDINYEARRPALQAMYDAKGLGWTVPVVMDEHDRANIRAGLAFAAAMPKPDALERAREITPEWCINMAKQGHICLLQTQE